MRNSSGTLQYPHADTIHLREAGLAVPDAKRIKKNEPECPICCVTKVRAAAMDLDH